MTAREFLRTFAAKPKNADKTKDIARLWLSLGQAERQINKMTAGRERHGALQAGTWQFPLH